MQFLGGKGRPVDAVLADAPARHDDDVPGQGPFLIAWLPVQAAGQQPDGAAVYQRLAEKPLVEHDGAVHRGHAGLVAAVFHSLAHALHDAAGMQQARGKLSRMEGRGETEDVGVAYQLRAHARAHGITVHAHDPGQRSAVGIKRGRTVVGLHLDAHVIIVVEGHHPRIVRKDGAAEIPLAAPLAQRGGRPHDKGSVQAVDFFRAPCAGILIMDFCGKNLVLAVF